jgi:hypothetical protein
MSRSYKKTPVTQDFGRRRKHDKQLANRKIRRAKYLEEISSGGHYKKFYDQYDICDWYSRHTLNDALEYRNKLLSDCSVGRFTYHAQYDEKYFNIQKCIKEWKKHYYWK